MDQFPFQQPLTRPLKNHGDIMYRWLTILFLATAVFAQEISRPIVAPEMTANLPAQPIGPNDLVAVSVYGAPEFSRTVRVNSDGFIRLPMLKQHIKVSGFYPEQIETAIANALEKEDILVDPFVTVTIAEYHSRPISVSGAVKQPLVFQADGSISLLEALARAQGLSAGAGLEILVTNASSDPGPHSSPLTRRIAVHDLIDNADPAANLKLFGGEEIRVPEINKVYVVGDVRRPGAYPLQGGGIDTTVLEVIALSEGLDTYASKTAYICRREASGSKNQIPVQLDKILQHKSPDVPLLANDILYVPDNRGKRFGIKALESIVGFGTNAGATAVAYGASH